MMRLSTLLLTVWVLVILVQAQNAIDIAVDFNPCNWKQCIHDEDCRVIDHSELLEIPVAVCVKKHVRPTEAGNCKTVSIGTNILNCKNALEWITIGQVQCTGEELEIDKRSLQTKYICHQKDGEEYKYLSAEFSCCQRETPSVLTVATPDTTMPSDRPKEDGWTTTEGVISGPHIEWQTHPTSSSDDYPTDLMETVPEDHHSNEDGLLVTNNDDNDYDDDKDKENHNDDDDDNDSDNGGDDDDDGDDNVDNVDDESNNQPVIVFLIAFALFACIVVLLGLGAYTRLLIKKRPNGYKGLPTVLVNPHCDEYKVVYEVPNYPEKQSLYPLHKKIYY